MRGTGHCFWHQRHISMLSLLLQRFAIHFKSFRWVAVTNFTNYALVNQDYLRVVVQLPMGVSCAEEQSVADYTMPIVTGYFPSASFNYFIHCFPQSSKAWTKITNYVLEGKSPLLLSAFVSNYLSVIQSLRNWATVMLVVICPSITGLGCLDSAPSTQLGCPDCFERSWHLRDCNVHFRTYLVKLKVNLNLRIYLTNPLHLQKMLATYFVWFG